MCQKYFSEHCLQINRPKQKDRRGAGTKIGGIGVGGGVGCWLPNERTQRLNHTCSLYYRLLLSAYFSLRDYCVAS